MLLRTRTDPPFAAPRHLGASRQCAACRQTTRMINNVIRSCGPVEALILAPDPPPVGDPLLLVETWGAATVEELAGLVCGESLLTAAFAALGKIPRGAEIIEVDPDISPADIDPRCDF